MKVLRIFFSEILLLIIQASHLPATPFHGNDSEDYLIESSIKLEFNVELLCQVFLP